MTRGKGRADCPIGKNPGGKPRKHPMQKVLDKQRLLQVAMDKGFTTYKELYDYLTEKIGERGRDKVVKKMSYGTWTYADICLVSDALKMTPAEFVGVWFANLFHEVDGEVVASIPDEDRQLYLERRLRSVSGGGKNRSSFREAKKNVEDIKDFLKTFD